MQQAIVRVEIVRYTEDYPPGLVEFRLVDADGREWLSEIKQVYVTDQFLTFESTFPQPGLLDCLIIERMGDRVRIEAEDREFIVPESMIVWPAEPA